jgi:hypothetical protein
MLPPLMALPVQVRLGLFWNHITTASDESLKRGDAQPQAAAGMRAMPSVDWTAWIDHWRGWVS